MAWEQYDDQRKNGQMSEREAAKKAYSLYKKTRKKVPSILKGKKKTGEHYRKLGEKATGKIYYTPSQRPK